MIIQVETEEEKGRLLSRCERNAFGCKIYALAHAYGFDKGFSCFWVDSESRAAYALSDGVMVISGSVGDPAEAGEFLRAVGADRVFCPLRTAEALGLRPDGTGDVLRKALPDGEHSPQSYREVNIRELYGLLSGSGMAVGEFEPFYLDLSHRLRHDSALVFTQRRDDALAGCAVVSAISGTGAILSAVAVQEEYRRQGIGSALVRRAEQALPGKTMYIFRERGAHAQFYRGLGYDWCDTWTTTALRG